MSVEWILVIVLSVVAAASLIAAVVFGIGYRRLRREGGAAGIKVKDGVRISVQEAIETDGKPVVTRLEGDVVLERGKRYVAQKGGEVLPGAYTLLATSESNASFRLRVGGFVREYRHGERIVLAEREEITAVSCAVILR